ncbi:MAG: UDP-N-acetylglucosamine 1-carboxyvinyltransferase [Caldicoprobacter oshimai]|uniref:UDP-N-acetylglucosamine 1-carboxyvinyltransferase n=1 Tax=Caldicoprobacter faecalis TaxID=937334 RepID=A0A1I5VPW1_9FIRM|nr:UDP-N-acetylglucosamine 1-carboxyvinyltransferase [Caldicoprobacter faecalis]PZN10416.1 MAG: UDP-N-acetylglucosamine 1-carboxyvinyltransferase [Caldicoprobacter oshimai]SFQ09594.1 UDP-N-acetylglucosamine 1-carboxyvinyltransferase [Caldicoprobacter faecalis]
MEKLVIRGGKKLIGSVKVSGAKNAAVAVMPAALLTDETCVIDNLPYIADVIMLAEILKQMGAQVTLEPRGRITINAAGVSSCRADYDLVRRMRASYYLLGALLGRFGRAEVAFPGGCEIGARPVDQHIKGFQALGADVSISHGLIKAYADKLVGNEVYLDVVSVGATINIMLAAVKAEGTTTIVNAAKEPHVVDVANFLNSMGANIKGAGTDTIKIKGVEKLHGCEYTIIPDQIEAGTFMIAAAATRGDVKITGVIPKHLEAVSAKLLEMGMYVEEGDDYVRVIGTGRPRKANIKTLPYPGFPTDLQQPMSVLLSVAEGTSIITENVWESRYRHVEELRRMGAIIRVEDRNAIIEGVEKLTGAQVEATDLRAGAALVIAGLIAEGVTEVTNIIHIDRGYERLEEKLRSLGADIERVSDQNNKVARLKLVKK